MDVANALGQWSAGNGPLHRKLADALAGAIERGDLGAGQRLPAERLLAKNLAVSRSTIVTAYDQLRADGWIESRQGSGTRVRWGAPVGMAREPVPGGSADVIFRRLISDPGGRDLDVSRAGTISLAAAILPGSPVVVEATTSFSAAELADLVAGSGYLPLGLGALRREVAQLHTRSGLPTSDDQILVTTGAQQAISLAADLLVQPGDVVLVENPSFSGCMDALRAAGARLVPVPIDDDGVDVDAFERMADQFSPAAAYIMPSFHNPTGVMLSESRRRRLARIVAERGLPLIEDNALAHASLRSTTPVPGPIASYADEDAPILSVRSMSKVLWGGLRVAWVRSSPALISRLVHCKAVHDLGSALFPQAVVARILPRLEEVEDDRRRQLAEYYGRAEALMRQHLPTWTWRPPQGGMALWVRMPAGNANELCQVALRHGVEVVAGTTMSPDGSFADHLRLAIIEPPLLDEAIARLGRAWEAYAPSALPSAGQRPHLRVIV